MTCATDVTQNSAVAFTEEANTIGSHENNIKLCPFGTGDGYEGHGLHGTGIAVWDSCHHEVSGEKNEHSRADAAVHVGLDEVIYLADYPLPGRYLANLSLVKILIRMSGTVGLKC